MIYTFIVFALFIAFISVIAFVRGAKMQTQALPVEKKRYGSASRCLWSLDHEA